MQGKTVVAIHQPNFFPWLGYFDKLARTDIFVLMDNVQFPKKGGSWSNRVQLIVSGQATWTTVPVVRSFHGTRMIRDIKINNSTPWREKLIKTVQMNYARAPFFDPVFSFFTNMVNNPTDSLVDYNREAIKAIAKSVDLDVSRLVIGSTMEVAGAATDLIINMTRAAGGTAYLAGGGAGGYQEDEKFAAAGIELIYQNFVHPVYPQCNTTVFVPGLSIIDALMNVGFEGVRAMFTGSMSAPE